MFALNVVQRFHIQEVYHASTLNAQNAEPICYPPLEVRLNLPFIACSLFLFFEGVFQIRLFCKKKLVPKDKPICIVVIRIA